MELIPAEGFAIPLEATVVDTMDVMEELITATMRCNKPWWART